SPPIRVVRFDRNRSSTPNAAHLWEISLIPFICIADSGLQIKAWRKANALQAREIVETAHLAVRLGVVPLDLHVAASSRLHGIDDVLDRYDDARTQIVRPVQAFVREHQGVRGVSGVHEVPFRPAGTPYRYWFVRLGGGVELRDKRRYDMTVRDI